MEGAVAAGEDAHGAAQLHGVEADGAERLLLLVDCGLRRPVIVVAIAADLAAAPADREGEGEEKWGLEGRREWGWSGFASSPFGGAAR